jgi:hypothetical protein
MKNLILLLASVALLVSTPAPSARAAEPQCSAFKKLAFKDATKDIRSESGSLIKDFSIRRADTGDFEIEAGEIPKLIKNKKTGRSCEAAVGAVMGKGDVYELTGSHYVLFDSFTGGERYFTLIDMKDCSKIWEKTFYVKGKVLRDRVVIPTSCGDCEGKGAAAKNCKCASKEIWKLGADCRMKDPYFEGQQQP